MSDVGRKLLRRALTVALVAATLVFLGLAIGRNWSQIVTFDWHIRPAELVASILVLVAALGWGVFVWERVVARFAADHPPFRTLIWVWFLSNLARYVPGKIWQFVGVVQLGRRVGLAAPVLLTSLVIQTGITLVSAALVSLLALPAMSRGIGPLGDAAVVAAAVLGIAAVHPAVLNFGIRLLPRRAQSEGMAWTGSWREGIMLLGLGVVAWLIYGAAFALLADSLVGIPLTLVPALIAANALAFLIGYLVFIAPGGLGAREAALTLMLGPIASLGVAAVIAVAFRLWLIAAELLGAGLAIALARPRSPAASGS